MEKDISRIVNYYVKQCGSRDPFDIAEYLKVEMQIGPLGSRCGCYMYLKRHRCIFINDNLSESDKRLVAAHELGHAILHQHENCYFMRNYTLLLTSKIEREANLFAADLLIPDEAIIEAIDRGYTVRQLARMVGYCEEFVELRLKHTNLNGQ